MALRLFCEYYDIEGNEWRIEIHQTGAHSAEQFLTTGGEGVVLRFDGQTDRIYTPIIGCSASFGIQAKDLANAEDFLNDLANAGELDFPVKITKDGEIQFVGYVLADNVSYEDSPDDYWINIRCSDGVATLKNIPYYDTDGNPYEGIATIKTIIKQCFERLPEIQSFYTTDPFFSFNINWWETSMDLGAPPMPLDVLLLDQEIFYGVEKDGSPLAKNCFEVLETICNRFLLRLKHSAGIFSFSQVTEEWKDAVRVWTYDKTGAAIAQSVFDRQVEIDHSTTYRIGGSGFSYLPGLREVKEKYKYFERRNLGLGKVYSNYLLNSPSFIARIDGSNDGVRLRIDGRFFCKIEHSNPAIWRDRAVKIALSIRLGDYYLRRTKLATTPGDGAYSKMEWVTDSTAVFEICTPLYPSYLVNILVPTVFQIETPGLTESGDLSISIPPLTVGQYNNQMVLLDPAGYSLYYFIGFNYLYAIADNEDLNPTGTYTATIQNTVKKYSVNYLHETGIGDGTSGAVLNRIRRLTALGTHENTAEWQVGYDAVGESEQIPISDLTVRELYKHQKTAIKKMTGGVTRGGLTFDNSLLYASAVWMPLSLTYNTYQQTWEGEWVAMETKELGGGVIIAGTDTGIPETPFGAGGDIGRVQQQINTNAINSVATLNEFLQEGDTITSIEVDGIAIDGEIVAGDIITIVDNTTGQPLHLTVTATPAAGDTTISVAETTLPFDVGHDSHILINPRITGIKTLNEYLPFVVLKKDEQVSEAADPILWFYRPPESLNGREIKAIHLGVFEAATNGYSVDIKVKKDGVDWQEVTFEEGDTSHRILLTDQFFNDDVFTVEAIGTADPDAPLGLTLTLEITGRANFFWVTPQGKIWTFQT